MTADVFISFASKDVKVAMTLCKALESRGFNCWVSARDIQAGENFQVAIVQAIRKAKLMLLVFTGNSNTSEEMTKELALASQQRKIVIPLRVEDVAPSDAFAYEFATRQWIDFFANWESAVELLAKRIAHALAEPAHVHDAVAAEAYAAVVLADNGDTLVADPVAKAPAAKAPPAPPPVDKAPPRAAPPPSAPVAEKPGAKPAPAPVVKPQAAAASASAPPAGKSPAAGAAQAEPGARNPAKARTLAIVAVVVVVIAAALGLAGALMRSGPTTTAKVAAPAAAGVTAAPVVPLPPPPPGGYPVAPQVAGAPLPTDTTLLPVVPVKPAVKRKAPAAPAADGPKDDILF